MTKLTRRQRMIAKYGGIDAYKAHMKAIAQKKRPNSPGGAFRNTDFAKRMGKIGGEKSRPKERK